MLKRLLSAFAGLGAPKPNSKRSSEGKRQLMTYAEARAEAERRFGKEFPFCDSKGNAWINHRFDDFMTGWCNTHGAGKAKRYMRAKAMRFGLGRRAKSYV